MKNCSERSGQFFSSTYDFFDALYTWVVTVTAAFLLTRFTDWSIVQIYLCVQFIDVLKVVIGLIMLRSDFWARNVVND